MAKKKNTTRCATTAVVALFVLLTVFVLSLSCFASESHVHHWYTRYVDGEYITICSECCGYDFDMNFIEHETSNCHVSIYYTERWNDDDHDNQINFCCNDCSWSTWLSKPDWDAMVAEGLLPHDTSTDSDISTDSGMTASIFDNIIAGIRGTLTGIGSTIVNFFETTVVSPTGGLTTFATWFLVFLGVGFSYGTVKFILSLIRR